MTIRIRQSMVITPSGDTEAALKWARDWVNAWTAMGWHKAGIWSESGEVVAEIFCETEVGDDAMETRED